MEVISKDYNRKYTIVRDHHESLMTENFKTETNKGYYFIRCQIYLEPWTLVPQIITAQYLFTDSDRLKKIILKNNGPYGM